MTFSQIIERFVTYAKENGNIRAAFIVGSRGGEVKPADRWSDLDIVIVAQTPSSLLNQEEWLCRMGMPYITFLEKTAVGGGTERRVLYEGGLDVDFAVFSEPDFHEKKQLNDVQQVLAKGFHVIIDKDKLTDDFDHLQQQAGSLDQPSPSGEEVINDMHDFWYHAVWAAKKIRRGELLVAKSACDEHMKPLLMNAIKLERQTRNGADIELWHGYRFFEEWAGPDLVERFTHLFPRYEANDIWSSLTETMKLYREMAKEVCARMDLQYPSQADAFATEWVTTLKNERCVPGTKW
nr:aminoglycoside 6-adenylyltransferase [Thalassobacillus sp. CUG 92003]